MSKPWYRVVCGECGYSAIRYANVRKCPRCGGWVTRGDMASQADVEQALKAEGYDRAIAEAERIAADLAAALARIARLEAAAKLARTHMTAALAAYAVSGDALKMRAVGAAIEAIDAALEAQP